MGPPVFVPRGRQFANWKIAGMGRGGSPLVVNRVTVSSFYWRARRGLDVETCLEEGFERDEISASMLLSETVPREVEFPYTATVLQRDVRIRVDAADVGLRLLEANGVWRARGQVRDRWIGLRGWGVAPEGISLATINDLAALPTTRWA